MCFQCLYIAIVTNSFPFIIHSLLTPSPLVTHSPYPPHSRPYRAPLVADYRTVLVLTQSPELLAGEMFLLIQLAEYATLPVQRHGFPEKDQSIRTL